MCPSSVVAPDAAAEGVGVLVPASLSVAVPEQAAERNSVAVTANDLAPPPSFHDACGLPFPDRDPSHTARPVHFPAFSSLLQGATVTRRNVAGMEVASLLGLTFCSLKRTSNSFCRSACRPFASAASNAFMVGP